MSHRLQVTLTDEQYATLRQRSHETGASIAELVRRSIDSGDHRGGASTQERLAQLRASAGAWSERPEEERVVSGHEYVEAIRRR